VYLDTSMEQVVISTLKETIPELSALYLFGSYADGTATEKSDIDIAYLSDREIPAPLRWEKAQLLAKKLSKDIDLIDLGKTNTVFRYQIISQGKRIYGQGYELDTFETLAYSFYLRFQEERKPIIDAIYKDGTITRKSHVS